MNTIQTDTSDAALITAIRANLCDLFKLFGELSVQEKDTGRFTRWLTPIQHPWFNGVLSTNTPTNDDSEFIKDSIDYFHKQGVGTFTWWLEPHLSAQNWDPILKKHGFGLSNDTPGMALDLKQLNESLKPVDGLEIRVVTDIDSLRAWAQVFVEGYGLPADWTNAIMEFWPRLGYDFPLRNYLALLNGKPVSTSMVYFGGGAAGIYCVATLAEARGKGIGAAVTLKPLQDAREMGYRIGTLQSSDMGFEVYKRLGFRHLCQIENFYFSR
jgi:ribosomal protein S18 acetylase RimI-like enzyme